MVSGCSLSEKHQTAPKGFPNPHGTMPISYYVICLVSNVMLMSLYAVQVYSPHQTCIVNGKNITHHYDLAFRLGFAILFADFFTTLCSCVHHRQCLLMSPVAKTICETS